MHKLIMTAVGLVLLSCGSAGAQSSTAGGTNPSTPPALSSDQRMLNAPIGHRQPRRDPSLEATDPLARDPADIALDRKIRSICRGC